MFEQLQGATSREEAVPDKLMYLFMSGQIMPGEYKTGRDITRLAPVNGIEGTIEVGTWGGV